VVAQCTCEEWIRELPDKSQSFRHLPTRISVSPRIIEVCLVMV
jgi:hypothetical protein